MSLGTIAIAVFLAYVVGFLAGGHFTVSGIVLRAKQPRTAIKLGKEFFYVVPESEYVDLECRALGAGKTS